MLKVEVSLVDGGAMDWSVDDSVYRRLLELRNDGLEGRDLVDSLLTDDWGAPPTGVRLAGMLEDGTKIDEYIPCSTRRRRQ
jgi:hypothetical protein